MVANSFLFKRTTRNHSPVTDLPPDLVTVFCSVCSVECYRHRYVSPVHPWEHAHNALLDIAVDLEKLGLRTSRGYRLGGRPACTGCYRTEMGHRVGYSEDTDA
jgi:hypothetical protein